MRLEDIINADFANLIYDYKDVELFSFNEGKLVIKTNNKDFIQELKLIEKSFKIDIVGDTIICY